MHYASVAALLAAPATPAAAPAVAMSAPVEAFCVVSKQQAANTRQHAPQLRDSCVLGIPVVCDRSQLPQVLEQRHGQPHLTPPQLTSSMTRRKEPGTPQHACTEVAHAIHETQHGLQHASRELSLWHTLPALSSNETPHN